MIILGFSTDDAALLASDQFIFVVFINIGMCGNLCSISALRIPTAHKWYNTALPSKHGLSAGGRKTTCIRGCL